MNSPDKNEAIFAALEFSVLTILSLITSLISSEKNVTAATYWLAMFFVVLLTTGALLIWARKRERSPTPTKTTTPPPQKTPSQRTTVAVLAGAVSGLVVSVLFFLMIGPGSHASVTPPDPLPTVTATPGSAAPASSGRLVTVDATPGDGGTQFGDDIAVTVTAARPVPAGDTYWLMVQFLGGSNVVYKAEGKVPATKGTTPYSISIASSAVGSTRKIYVLQADRQATAALAQNYAHQEPGWDGNRTSLPSGVVTVSNSITVTKQTG